jgi:glutathione peroxidase
VNGDDAHPVFVFCKENNKEKKGPAKIPWNFGKFLVNGKGEVLGFYDAKEAKPIHLEEKICELLGGEHMIHDLSLLVFD